MIDEADIFQLFWSASSGTSPYVEQEWQYALRLASRKGPSFIRPVYWQKPLSKVPDALSTIHFAPVDFSRYAPSAPKPHAGPSGLARLLPAAGEDLKTITVSTYTATDPAQPGDARLRARTRISLGGDVDTYLTEEDSGNYPEVHHKIVREAVAARLAYLDLILKKGEE